jgi:hypothetical protein
MAIRELGASVIDATDISAYAVEYAVNGWPVFPLRGKVPAIPKKLGGCGVLDATTDIDQITAWWSGPYKGCNIGGRVPDPVIVIDIDPRSRGHLSVAALQHRYGRLPETLTHLSGRGDGGKHLFYRRPQGRLTGSRLGNGIDLKTSSGYVVLPPSIHPATGKPYTRIDAPIAAPPRWLIDLLQPPMVLPYTSSRNGRTGGRYSLRCLISRINAAPEGQRNVTVFGAMRDALRDGNLAEFQDDLFAAGLALGLSHNEVKGILKSVQTNGAPS